MNKEKKEDRHKEDILSKRATQKANQKGLAPGEEPRPELRKKEPQEAQQLPEELKLSYQDYKSLKEKSDLADQYFDKLLRLQAETENIKKRLARERDEFIKYANEELITELISIIDDFHRAIDSANKNHDLKLLMQGVDMIATHLQNILKQKGLEEIAEVKVAFDHNRHEAVATEISEAYPENTVIEVLRKGYMLNGRIIRPAMVKVSKQRTENREQRTEENK